MKVLAILTAAFALVASNARAEIVVFKNGRSMSVKAVRMDADLTTMTLRAGGEVTFPSSIVARVEPDELPYPSDEPEPAAEVAMTPLVKPALVPDEVLAA